MTLYIILAFSIVVNILLLWYLKGVLGKLLFISENLADLHLVVKSFQLFVGSLYKMTSYNGEPMIEELVLRTKEVNDEIESFREIFELTIDEELEGELNDAAEEAAQEENQEPLLHQSS